MDEPVDAVITWVDGNDSVHAAKLRTFLAALGQGLPEAAAPTRFNQCGELTFCVLSVLQFAPWINTLYIVTDAQIPPILQQLSGTIYAKKIKLIDHREIFSGYEQALPTFNSLSIETMLFRIKGLATQFIYLNDDCMIIRPVVYDDFFRAGKVVLRGYWKPFMARKWRNIAKGWLNKYLPYDFKLKTPTAHRALQEKSAQLAGFTERFFDLPHAPFSMNKSTIDDFFAQHTQVLVQNISYALRDAQQFWLVSLVMHLEIKASLAVYDNTLKAIMVNGCHHSLQKIKSRLARADKDSNIAFICMQSVDSAPDEIKDYVMQWLTKRIELKVGSISINE